MKKLILGTIYHVKYGSLIRRLPAEFLGIFSKKTVSPNFGPYHDFDVLTCTHYKSIQKGRSIFCRVPPKTIQYIEPVKLSDLALFMWMPIKTDLFNSLLKGEEV